MLTKEKLVEMLEQLTEQVKKMPSDAKFIRAGYSEFEGFSELFVRPETMNNIIFGDVMFIYTVTPWEDYDFTEISVRIGSVKVYALYDEEEFNRFRALEFEGFQKTLKTPDAATSEVKEEEFAERMNDLRNLLLPDIVTPADDKVKEDKD